MKNKINTCKLLLNTCVTYIHVKKLFSQTHPSPIGNTSEGAVPQQIQQPR